MDDWYTHLKKLIQENEFRKKLAQDGHEKALERESAKMAGIWAAVLQKTIMVGKPKSSSKGGM
jgi:hypothetical protein